ncbi:MAG: aminotransferase class V-fold PLP-dependent enzyme [Proteobacteria bacterium]|nr:aminotransferase class V-fold PLP-dependent enzyme [Pseudomonadota bacterium]
MANVFERLGVRTIINAKGPATRVSGGLMWPEAAAAMEEASQHCVDILELQARASEIIAEATGAEAGLVTSGASAALLLGAAACITGLDPARMNRLPDTSGLKGEVVVPRSHRNFYDHAVRATGARLVEVGLADRFAGAGVRDAEAWEIAEAIGERTAAVLYVAQPHALPSLREVAEAAHAKGVPVLVDAAAQLPPASNLRRFIAEGADLVAFSGGKAIFGPQASGVLCGRRDLVAAAALQTLDQDIFFEQWNPPPGFIDKARLKGLPQHGIGRSCKVGKEEIVGLLTALRLFAASEAHPRAPLWRVYVEELAGALKGLQHARVEVVEDGIKTGVPGVRLTLDTEAAGMSALDLVCRLQEGTPGIQADPGRWRERIVTFNPMCLKPGEPALIARRVRELIR